MMDKKNYNFNKHAFLIIAHNEFEILKILIEMLDYEYNDIYIHIDKKVKKFDFEKFKNIPKKSKIIFIKNRINVKWGSYSQVQCELNLIKEASEIGYSYYHLLSGVDLPLKTPKEIYSFFEASGKKEFIHFDSPKLEEKYYYRVSKYYFMISRKSSYLKKILHGINMILQKPVNRMKKNNIEYQKGANWFSITNDLVDYILHNIDFIHKNFKFTHCPDEMFLQTLVCNSKFNDNLYDKNYSGSYKAIYRLIDWKRGNPYTYRMEDYEELISSNMMFARKFSVKIDDKIIYKLREDILQN